MSITLAEMEVAARDMQVAAEQVCGVMLRQEALLQTPHALCHVWSVL
jgi:hypothetical protein